MGQVYPRVGLDYFMSGWVKIFPLLMNRVGMAPIAKSVLKYINITSIAYLHCLPRFCRVWFCWSQNSWVAWVGLGLFDPGLGQVGR